MTIRYLKGPVIRTLGEEIGRVVRGRASNPKWISGAMRHGYKGAFEMAATVDYLFAFSPLRVRWPSTILQHFKRPILKMKLFASFEDANDLAYRDMFDRFDEAISRGLWTPRRNSVQSDLERFRAP